MERTETIGFKVRALANSIRNIGSKSSGCQFAVNENSRKLTHVHGWVIGFLYDNRDRDVFQKDVEKQFAVSLLLHSFGYIYFFNGHIEGRVEFTPLNDNGR